MNVIPSTGTDSGTYQSMTEETAEREIAVYRVVVVEDKREQK
jgi:hypothetical protein